MKYTMQLQNYLLLAILLLISGGCGNGPSPSKMSPAPSKNYPAPSEYYDDANMIALIKAVQQDDVKEIDRLVEKGVNVNQKAKKYGFTPLFFALSARKKKSFEALLNHKADPNILCDLTIGSIVHATADVKDDSEWLQMTLKHGGDPNVENLIDIACAHKPPLYYAIKSRNVKNVKLLIDAGADINHQDDCGNTPSMDAASFRRYRILFLLLEKGADWKIQDNQGNDLAETCYMYPQKNKKDFPEGYEYYQKVLEFLKEKGVELEAAKKGAGGR